MKRPKSHQTDDLAQAILLEILGRSWVVNEQKKDYGKDYLVEFVDSHDNLMGTSFYIQLKGTQKTIRDKTTNAVRFVLESKYAAYYVDKVRDLPVFLVVVDIELRKGWWIFIQAALKAYSSWRNKKTITLRLPSENDIQDAARLLNAVYNAKQWMHQQAPGFRSPFLQQCCEHVTDDLGCPTYVRFETGTKETMILHYLPTLPDGIPSYEAGSSAWSFYNSSEIDKNLHINVTSHGEFSLTAADDDGVYLDLPIDSPEEIGELLAFIENFKELQSLSSPCSVSTPIARLITSLHMLVPHYGSHVLITPEELITAVPAAKTILNATATNNWDTIVRIGFRGWNEWCHDNIPSSLKINRLTNASNLALFTEDGSLVTYRRWLAYDTIHQGFLPVFALTVNMSTCSMMWLSQFVNRTAEGKATFRRLIENWQTFAKAASQRHVELPSLVIEQIRICIEKRVN